MSERIISKRTVAEFVDAFSDHFVLRDVGRMFSFAGIFPNEDPNYRGPHGTERRDLAESHISTLDLTNQADASALLAVFEDVLQKLEEYQQAGSAEAGRTIQRLKLKLKADGFLYEEGRISPSGVATLLTLNAIATTIDLAYVRNQVRRLEEAVEKDPEAAIGGAKELIETCCRTILTEEGVTGVETMDVPQLIKQVKTVLRLTPENVPETARGKDAMNKLFGALSSTAVALAELRNEYGTGHGKHGKTSTPKPRHARLAVGAAAALATFLFETHLVRSAAQKAEA